MSESKDMVHIQCQIKNTFSEYYFIVSNEILWYLSLCWYSLFSFPSSITSLSRRLSWETKEDHLWSSKYQNPSQKIRSYYKKSIVFKTYHCDSQYSLWIFCDNHEDVQTDFLIRIVHSLVIVFEKKMSYDHRESSFTESHSDM